MLTSKRCNIKKIRARHWKLIAIILATWEAEIRRISK
jgi:hypothetical protein